ncbi:MAG: peptidylprolyl isomerase [Clostridia bacterium]|nr:peptidylprolyl isomerase [Clostridia bacterium]
MKRFFALCVALIIVLSLFAACSGDAPTGDTKLDKEIVGTVDTVEVTQADYNLVYRTMYDNISQYEQYYGADWFVQSYDGINTLGQMVSRNTASQLEVMIAATVLAKEKYGIEEDSKEIEKAVNKEYKAFKENFSTDSEYEKFLSEAKTTDKAVKNSITMSEIMMSLQEKVTAKGEEAYVSDEEALESFSDAKMRVQHILISTQEQTDPETGDVIPARSDKEALKIVDEVIGKLNKGEDFDSLIDKYDEDPGMESGKFYVFGTGEMVQEFEDASMALKIGEYTKQGVKTDYGYHIIKRYDVNADLPEFTEYKENILNQKFGEILNSRAEEFKINWKTDALDKYVFNWVNEIRASKGAEPITEEMMGISLPEEEESETKKENE